MTFFSEFWVYLLQFCFNVSAMVYKKMVIGLFTHKHEFISLISDFFPRIQNLHLAIFTFISEKIQQLFHLTILTSSVNQSLHLANVIIFYFCHGIKNLKVSGNFLFYKSDFFIQYPITEFTSHNFLWILSLHFTIHFFMLWYKTFFFFFF